jgi:tetrahedral aminopeptidase
MKTKKLFQIQEKQISLLKSLCEASGVSGDEGEVRKIVLEEVKPLADEVKVDALGNVIALRKGSAEKRLKVMLAAHMDEIGLMVTVDDGGGLYQFTTVSGIDVRQLPGKPVWVGHDHVPAVIGARAIHLTTAEERKHSIPLDTLRLDVGLEGEGNKKIKPGDRAAFATPFYSNDTSFRGKALDDRLGVAALIELLKMHFEQIDLYAVFTTQEEIGGARGAQVAAFSIHPDLAIAVDSTPANDMPAPDGSENTLYNTHVGEGPAIYSMDRGTISDARLIGHICKTGDAHSIPYQMRQSGGGGTDAGAIHRQHAGIPSVSVSTPARFLHTACLLAYQSDWENLINLLAHTLHDLPLDILNAEKRGLS